VARQEDHILPVVFGPVPVYNPSFFVQIGIEVGYGKRGQTAIVHAGEPGSLYEIDGGRDALRGILIESEDERTLG
jgi:hypothetical protein